jgi:hypothetical protein
VYELLTVTDGMRALISRKARHGDQELAWNRACERSAIAVSSWSPTT